MIELPVGNQLILFDGICNLCNASVNFIIKHDKKDRFRFAPIQSKVGQQIVKEHNIDTSRCDSIILYCEKDGLTYKSTAALKIAMILGFPIRIFGVFFIVPPFIRNWVYYFIAKNRYKWYGKQETCMVPSPELQKKFI